MQLPGHQPERSPLNNEMRHSALLLGGSLGLMSLLALLLLVISSHLAG